MTKNALPQTQPPIGAQYGSVKPQIEQDCLSSNHFCDTTTISDRTPDPPLHGWMLNARKVVELHRQAPRIALALVFFSQTLALVMLQATPNEPATNWSNLALSS